MQQFWSSYLRGVVHIRCIQLERPRSVESSVLYSVRAHRDAAGFVDGAGQVVCTTIAAVSTSDADMLPLLHVSVDGQPERATVTFQFYDFTGFVPAMGPSLGTPLTLMGIGFTRGTPRLVAQNGASSVAPFIGTILNRSALSFAVNVSSLVGTGTAVGCALSSTLNAVDFIAVPGGTFTAYNTAVTDADIESGPLSGGTLVTFAGCRRAGNRRLT